jgi:hypothetical protein
MASPFSDQELLDLEAEARARARIRIEDEQRQGSIKSALDRGRREPIPLGPNYDQSISGNYGKGWEDLIPSAIHLGENAISGADDYPQIPMPFGPITGMIGGALDIHPQDFTNQAGIEKTIDTVGSLALGTAGSLVGGPVGAGLGLLTSPVTGPVGPFLGGLAGFGAGFGAGAGAYEVVKDSAIDLANKYLNPQAPSAMRPYDQYLKDAAYNSAQGSGFMGLNELAGAAGSGLRRVGTKVIPDSVDVQAGKYLEKNYPGIGDKLDAALAPDSPNINDPLFQYKSTGEVLNDPIMLAEQRAMQSAGPKNLAKSTNARAARNDAQLKYLDSIANPDFGIPERVLANTKKLKPNEEGLVPLDQFELTDLPALESSGLIRKGKSGKPGVDFAALEEINATKISELEAGRFGPDVVKDTINESIGNELANKQSQIDTLSDAIRTGTSSLPPPIDSIYGGQTVRGAISKGLEAQEGIVAQKFQGIGKGAVQPDAIAEVVATEMPKYFKDIEGDAIGAQASDSLLNLVKSLTREGEPILGLNKEPILGADGNPILNTPTYNMEHMQAARSKATEIVKTGDRRSASVASKIIGAIDDAVKNAMDAGTITPEQSSSWKAGIEARKTQGRIFEHRKLPTKSVLSKEYSGEFSVPDSAVLPNYFKTGDKGAREAIRNFKEAYGGSLEAMDALERHAVDSFRRMAINEDGLIDATRANAWRSQYKGALEELPDLKAELSNNIKAQELLNNLGQNLKASKAEIAKGNLQFWLGDIEPARAIEKMLGSKETRAKRLMATTSYIKSKGPLALTGLRRGIIEYVQNQAYIEGGSVKIADARLPGGEQFQGAVSDAALKRVWKELSPDLKKSKVFTDSQMKGFDTLYLDKFSQGLVDSAKPRGESTSVANVTTLGRIIRGTSSLASGLGLGRFGIVRAMGEYAQVLAKMSQAKIMERIHEGLLDPRIARDLQNKATPKNIESSMKALFGDEIKAFYSAAEATGAAVPPPTTRRRPPVPRQHEVLSRKSFPTPDELLRPPAPKTDKISLNLQDLIDKQPKEFQAQIEVESGFNPAAVSPKGAQGLAQLMPETAMEIAGQLGETYIPLDPIMPPEQQMKSIEQNLRFGRHYMKQQMEKYGNRTLALAAYNAGPGRIDSAIRKAGTSTDVRKIMASLPQGVQAETVPYVEKILKRLL